MQFFLRCWYFWSLLSFKFRFNLVLELKFITSVLRSSDYDFHHSLLCSNQINQFIISSNADGEQKHK